MSASHHPNNMILPAVHCMLRRTVAAALVATPALWLAPQVYSQTRRATPRQTEGPYYPVEIPRDSDFDLLHNGALSYANGQASWVEGSVTDLQGKPVAGAQVEIWQCDEAGHYHHPGDGNRADKAFQGFGKVVVGADGQYRFRTIKPVAYSGRTPHIHVKVKLGTRHLLITQMYVQGDAGNAHDSLWRTLSTEDRAAVTVQFAATTDGLRANFPIVVAGA